MTQRSSARADAARIRGTAAIPARDFLVEAFQRVMAYAATGDLQIDTERVPLADIANAWRREQPGRRLAIIP